MEVAGLLAGAADLMATPLFQISLLPFLIHVYSLPLWVTLELRVLHVAPAFICAEKAKFGTKIRLAISA